MFEVIARGNPLGTAEWRVVEIRGGLHDDPVLHRDRRRAPRIEARFRFSRPIPLEFVEGTKYHHWPRHFVDFAPHSTVSGWDSGRIDAQVVQRSRDRATAFE